MNLLSSNGYKDQVEQSLSSIVGSQGLENKAILVTGASGLIGSTIVDQLIVLNLSYQLGITIYCCGRNLSALEERFGLDHDFCHFVAYDASKALEIDQEIDFIIHAASPASPDLYVKQPVETMTSNFLGMYNLLEFAKAKNVSKIVYVSSSEVYGVGEINDPIKEDYIGKVDHLNIRSSYASSKRATETLCMSFADEFGLDIKIVRPGHIYGPSAKSSDQRVSSFFMTEALKGHAIIMKSSGEQLRSYCHSLDCASAILTVLLLGKSGEVYNISNPNSIITIRQMAELIAQVAKVDLVMDLPDEQDQRQANPMQNASLNSDKLEKLGWVGAFPASEGFQATYDVLKELSHEHT